MAFLLVNALGNEEATLLLLEIKLGHIDVITIISLLPALLIPLPFQ